MEQNIAKIINGLSALKTDSNGLEGVVLANEEDILFSERYVNNHSRDIYSHTKSFMVTALGVAVDNGQIKLSDRLCDYFPEHAEKPHDPAIDRITLEHLLTMTAGFNDTYLQTLKRRAGEGMPDYTAYMFNQKTDTEPGSTFFYTSSQSHLAGCMLARAVKKPLRIYVYETLFEPLGIGYPIWECEPGGEAFCGSGLVLGIEDQVKLGQLCLAGGDYRGRRVVSKGWLEQATSKKVDTGKEGPWDVGYGYQFWTAAMPNAYCARGAYGQNTYILPDAHLVVSIQTSEGNSDLRQIEQGLTEALFG